MNNTLDYIVKKFNLNLNQKVPIDIKDTGRDELAVLFAELEFSRGAEIGVERGLYSEVLCKANPKLQLYCIDPWITYHEYRDYVTQSKLDRVYEEAITRLKPYRAKIIRDFSENAYKEFADGGLDFIYIDGNHDALHVLQDITFWTPKVKKGGIIAGHDFVRYKGEYGLFNQVKVTVLAYTESNRVNPWFVLRDPRERSSWMWVK